MKTVANCFDLTEALRRKMVLEAAGIPAFLPDEISAGIAPHQFFHQIGVRVQVADEHEAEARRILDSQSGEK